MRFSANRWATARFQPVTYQYVDEKVLVASRAQKQYALRSLDVTKRALDAACVSAHGKLVSTAHCLGLLL